MAMIMRYAPFLCFSRVCFIGLVKLMSTKVMCFVHRLDEELSCFLLKSCYLIEFWMTNLNMYSVLL